MLTLKKKVADKEAYGSDVYAILTCSISSVFDYSLLSECDEEDEKLAKHKTFFLQNPGELKRFINSGLSKLALKKLFRNYCLPQDEVFPTLTDLWNKELISPKEFTKNPSFMLFVMANPNHEAVCYITLLTLPFYAEEALNDDNSVAFFHYVSQNTGISFTPSVLEKYEHLWSWEMLMLNPSVSFTLSKILALLEQKECELDVFFTQSPQLAIPEIFEYFATTFSSEEISVFECMSANNHISFTEELVRKYADRWFFNVLSENTNVVFTRELLLDFADRWDWSRLSKNPSLFKHDPAMILCIGGYLTDDLFDNKSAVLDMHVPLQKSLLSNMCSRRQDWLRKKYNIPESLKRCEIVTDAWCALSLSIDGSDPFVRCQIPEIPVAHVQTNESFTENRFVKEFIENEMKKLLPEECYCAICKDVATLSNLVFVCPCMHIFHNECIQQSRNHSQRCPVCRENIATCLPMETMTKMMKRHEQFKESLSSAVSKFVNK